MFSLFLFYSLSQHRGGKDEAHRGGCAPTDGSSAEAQHAAQPFRVSAGMHAPLICSFFLTHAFCGIQGFKIALCISRQTAVHLSRGGCCAHAISRVESIS